jgi:hypothetical protein
MWMMFDRVILYKYPIAPLLRLAYIRMWNEYHTFHATWADRNEWLAAFPQLPMGEWHRQMQRPFFRDCFDSSELLWLRGDLLRDDMDVRLQGRLYKLMFGAQGLRALGRCCGLCHRRWHIPAMHLFYVCPEVGRVSHLIHGERFILDTLRHWRPSASEVIPGWSRTALMTLIRRHEIEQLFSLAATR